MPTQSQALRLMLEAIRAMRAAGYTQEDVQVLVTAAFQHLEGKPHQPYACGHCPPLQPHHHRVVGLPVERPRARTLPQVRQALATPTSRLLPTIFHRVKRGQDVVAPRVDIHLMATISQHPLQLRHRTLGNRDSP